MDTLINDKYSNLQTGDLLLYDERSYFLSQVVKFFTFSEYSHISMVLRDPEFPGHSLKGLYIIESSIADIGKLRAGVRIVPLEPVVENYDGKIYVRRLETTRDQSFYEKLTTAHSKVHGDGYDTYPIDMFESIVTENFEGGGLEKWLTYDNRRTDKFWCSALIAFIYTELGFLPKDTKWTLILPKQFSADAHRGELLEFQNCTLGSQEIIRQ